VLPASQHVCPQVTDHWIAHPLLAAQLLLLRVLVEWRQLQMHRRRVHSRVEPKLDCWRRQHVLLLLVERQLPAVLLVVCQHLLLDLLPLLQAGVSTKPP
jgi:hypothetical protein